MHSGQLRFMTFIFEEYSTFDRLAALSHDFCTSEMHNLLDKSTFTWRNVLCVFLFPYSDCIYADFNYINKFSNLHTSVHIKVSYLFLDCPHEANLLISIGIRYWESELTGDCSLQTQRAWSGYGLYVSTRTSTLCPDICWSIAAVSLSYEISGRYFQSLCML